MSPPVSVIVNNFNYERYLATAIESALSQDHASVEVIVVDDGSTDGSREVIAGYDGRAKAILKPNGGQASAMNAGFDASSGEIVIFLDADDFLESTAASSVASAWVDGCAKVQYRLSIVDEDGDRLGAFPPPEVAMPSGDVVPLIAARGGYTTPVTSGNAYARGVLDALLPIPEQDFRISADGYLNFLAPFYGDVVSLEIELGAYRRHSSNRWTLSGDVSEKALRAHVEHDLTRQRYVLETARRRGRSMPQDLALRDWGHVLHRLASLRLDRSAHPSDRDTRRGLAIAGVRAVRGSTGLAGAERIGYGGLILALAAAPSWLVPWLVDWALASRPRPAWLRLARRALRKLTIRGGAGSVS